jgi:hypothetical protein
MYKGDTEIMNIVVKTSLNAPIDITGSTIYFTMKRDLNDTDALAALQKIVTSHTGATSGLSQVKIEPEDTINLYPGKYYYDMQFKDAAGNIKTFVLGSLTLIETVTKAI